MPEHDLGLLITLNIGLTLTGILAAMIGVWAMMRQDIRSQEIAERIDARLRRQYTDIDRDLRDIKDLLGGCPRITPNASLGHAESCGSCVKPSVVSTL